MRRIAILLVALASCTMETTPLGPGPTGASGPEGAIGATGEPGATGPSGATGPTGSIGATGDPGPSTPWTIGPGYTYYDGGRVGIGTTTPTADLQVSGTFAAPLTGTVAVLAGGSTLIGLGTLFTQEVRVGDAIKVAGEVFTVATITNDTQLTLSANHVAGATNATAYTDGDLLSVQNGAGEAKLVVDRSGRLGLGATTLQDRLHVAFGPGDSRRALAVTDDYGAQAVLVPTGLGVPGNSYANVGYNFFASSPSALRYRSGYNYASGAGFGLDGINFWTAVAGNGGDPLTPAVRMTVARSGNVGIGTANPTAMLHVLQEQGGMSNTYASRVGMVDGDQNADVFFHTKGTGGTPDDRHLINAQYGGATRLVVRGDGNVGIGLSVPGQPLDVNGTIRSRWAFQLNDGTTTGGGLFFHKAIFGSGTSLAPYLFAETGNSLYFGTNGSADVRMLIDTAGNVGIGTTTPVVPLQVIGDIRVGTSGTNGCLQRFDGAALAGSCASDERLKKSIASLDGALSKLAGLRPVTFEWRSAEFPDRHLGAGRQYGLIAQEVERVAPDFVDRGDDGYMSVKYGPEVSMLTMQAIKELKTEKDQLAGEVADLRSRLARLEAAAPQGEHAGRTTAPWLGLGLAVAVIGVVGIRRRRGPEADGTGGRS
ncbi:MAG: tail fiber domain-containing protein [Deltaproteobacteria bacterium]|nr:tail fiber domain-containing protein [Deltaproteobacteria bacterium]